MLSSSGRFSLDYFVLVLFAFVVLGLVSSVLCQEIGWEERLQNDLLVHGQVTIIFVVSVCLFVYAEFFSAVFDLISIKLGHTLYVWV